MPEIEKIHLDMDKSVDTHVWVSHQLGGYCKMCDCDWEEPRACLPCHVALCWAGCPAEQMELIAMDGPRFLALLRGLWCFGVFLRAMGKGIA